MLCSDGLWSEFEDEELCDILSNHAPQSAARELIQMALDRDCQDNVTVQVIRVVNVDAALAPSRNGWLSTIFQRGQV